MLGRLGQFADRTRSLAAEALEALDVPAEGGPDDTRQPSPELTALPTDVFERSLVQLVESVSGTSIEEQSNLLHQCSVLLTQIDVIRQEAVGAKQLTLHQRDIASRGSLVELVDVLITTTGGDTATTLLEALEQEQTDHMKTRSKHNLQIRELQSQLEELTQRVALLTEKSVHQQQELEILISENRQLRHSLEKVVNDKAQLELERDNNELIDARILRSAFVSLSANADNKRIRQPILVMLAELLKLSAEDMERAGLGVQRTRSGLATEFLQFLHEETFVDSGELEGT
jgi:hypothetical protein